MRRVAMWLEVGALPAQGVRSAPRCGAPGHLVRGPAGVGEGRPLELPDGERRPPNARLRRRSGRRLHDRRHRPEPRVGDDPALHRRHHPDRSERDPGVVVRGHARRSRGSRPGHARAGARNDHPGHPRPRVGADDAVHAGCVDHLLAGGRGAVRREGPGLGLRGRSRERRPRHHAGARNGSAVPPRTAWATISSSGSNGSPSPERRASAGSPSGSLLLLRRTRSRS